MSQMKDVQQVVLIGTVGEYSKQGAVTTINVCSQPANILHRGNLNIRKLHYCGEWVKESCCFHF